MARRPTKKITAPETTALSRYGIPYLRFLEVDGSLVESAPAFAAQDELLIKLYAAMKRTRIFDAKAIALQRTGRLGTYASALGEEAVGVGVASAMREDDVLLPSFREQAAQLWRGVTPIELLLYWGGDERGSDFGVPREDFPVSIPVASHATHAAGVALAFKIRGENRAAVAVFGDGLLPCLSSLLFRDVQPAVLDEWGFRRTVDQSVRIRVNQVKESRDQGLAGPIDCEKGCGSAALILRRV